MDGLTEKFIRSNSIFNGKILNLVCDTVQLPNGKEATREVVHHPGAVAVVPILEDGCIVLVRQYRYPIGKILLEIPAGKLEPEEDPDECARRELKEETGYIAGTIKKLTAIYTTPGFSNEVIHLYLALNMKLAEVCPDEDEFIKVETYSRSKIKAMIHDGLITDAKTILGLLMAGL
ncbi:MAG: NUDIX hydrolase [Veillonellales bacterium]